jgi:hypothetical protein
MAMTLASSRSVANSAKDKGDRAEREAAELLTSLTGHTARRELGAGRKDDQGDIDGLPHCAVQVVWWKDIVAALRLKPIGVEEQRINRGARYAITMLRLSRAGFRVVLTPEQFAALYLDALKGLQKPQS